MSEFSTRSGSRSGSGRAQWSDFRFTCVSIIEPPSSFARIKLLAPAHNAVPPSAPGGSTRRKPAAEAAKAKQPSRASPPCDDTLRSPPSPSMTTALLESRNRSVLAPAFAGAMDVVAMMEIEAVREAAATVADDDEDGGGGAPGAFASMGQKWAQQAEEEILGEGR